MVCTKVRIHLNGPPTIPLLRRPWTPPRCWQFGNPVTALLTDWRCLLPSMGTARRGTRRAFEITGPVIDGLGALSSSPGIDVPSQAPAKAGPSLFSMRSHFLTFRPLPPRAESALYITLAQYCVRIATRWRGGPGGGRPTFQGLMDAGENQAWISKQDCNTPRQPE